MSRATLEPKVGHEGAYHVRLVWGEERPQPEGTDAAAVLSGRISVSWLSRITALGADTPTVDSVLNRLMAAGEVATAQAEPGPPPEPVAPSGDPRATPV
jgi:hypothetical protein